MADDTTLTLGGDPSGAVAAIREVAAELRTMTEKNAAAFSTFGEKFDAAVGKRVPEGAEKARKSVGLFDEQWRKMTTAFSAASLIDRGVGLLTTGLTQILQHARNTATVMTDLSDRTGHSVEFLQRAGYAARVAGFDFEKFAAGAFTLGTKLAGGSGSVREAVDTLGIGWDELLAMDVDERMYDIMRAAASIADPIERNRALTVLFGGSAKTMADAAQAAMQQVGQAAMTLSRQQLQAIKDVEAGAKKTWEWVKGTGAILVTEAVRGFTELGAAVDTLTEAEKAELAVQDQLGLGHLYLVGLAAKRAKSIGDVNLATVVGVSTTEKYAKANAEAYEDLYALTGEQRRQILSALELGATTEDLVNEFGTSVGALKLLEQETKRQAEADKAGAEEARRHADERRKFSEALFGRDQIAKAQQYTSALGGVGNVSRLTRDKQEELNEAVSKALVVYRQLGERAPQDLRRVAAATATALAGFENAKVLQFDDIFKVDTSTPTYVPQIEWNFERKTEVKFEDIFNVTTGGSPVPPAAMGRWAKGISGALQAALQGGGDVSKSVGASIGASIFEDGGAAQKAIAKGAAKILPAGMATALGSVVPGLGTAIGAMAGELVGKLAGALRKTEHKEIMKDVGRQWGVSISESLAKQIEKDAQELFGRDRVAGTIFNLDKVIEEAGGLNSGNYNMFLGKLRDVFSMIDVGKFSVEQGRAVLDENFGTFAAQVQSSKEIASASFLELFALNERFGTESAAMRGFVEGQTATIGRGLAAQLASISAGYKDLGPNIEKARAEVARLAAEGQTGSAAHGKAVAELNQLLERQKAGAAAVGDDVARVGRLAVASFNAAIAKGADWKTAIEGIGPALDQITALQKTLGIESSDAAVQELQRYRQLTQEHAGLFEAAGALNEVMVAMSSIGALNADTLADLEAQGLDTFNSLTAAGLTEQQALMQMKDWVKNVDKAHRELGIPVDENTQKLLDQARAQGILEEEGTSTNDILMDGLGAMIEALGGELPAAWKKSADKAAEEAERTRRATAVVAGGVQGVASQVEGIDWEGMAERAVEALGEVEDSVNAVSFGHSPGGLKEYPLLLGKAGAAMKSWRRDWASELRAVEQRVNEMGLPAMARATHYAAAATASSGSGAAAGAASTAVNVEAFADIFVAVDPTTGAVRQVTDRREIDRMVQQGLREGRYSLPVRNVTGRAA